MAVGIAPAVANEILDAIGNNGATTILTALSQVFVQLHTGDPGGSAANAVAGNATRELVPFASATGGTMTSDGVVAWDTSEVDTSEDYTHFSLWSASSGGTFIWSGTVTANPVVAGDAFEFPSGAFVLGLGIAA